MTAAAARVLWALLRILGHTNRTILHWHQEEPNAPL